MQIQLLLSIIGVLLAALGYFVKRILDKVDHMSDDLTDLKIYLSDIKPKVDLLWKYHLNHADTSAKL